VSALPLVRVRLKYPDVETLVERFSPNVTRGGIFLASREPRAVGSLVRFEVSLLTGTSVLAGEGKVTWVKPFDPAAPARPHGMGVSFTRIDPSCRDMFRRLVERRETNPAPRRPGPQAGGPGMSSSPPPALPFSAELEGIDDASFRRAIDRARTLAARIDNVDELLVREAEEPPSLEQALADLPRYLQVRRSTGGSPRTGVGVPAVSEAALNGLATEATPADPEGLAPRPQATEPGPDSPDNSPSDSPT
jgi:molecular chaperone DnaK